LTATIRDTHRDRTEEIKTRILIGADGMSSRVAKTATSNCHETTPLLQAIVELPRGARPGTTQVWFEPTDTRYFYWLIPQSETHAAVGFIAEEGKSARSRLERFLGRIGLKAVEMQSARIPGYTHSVRPWRRIGGSEIYLIGDAAAQVKVTTVGGLVTGLRGARAAANAILHGSNYMKELRSLRRELSLHLVIRNMLNRFGGADYDRLLDLLNPRTIELLGRYNRDHAAKMLYRIILAQPRFLNYVAMFRGRIWPGAANEEVYAQPEPSNRI
jgi:flavin-dependent dehydrogenase